MSETFCGVLCDRAPDGLLVLGGLLCSCTGRKRLSHGAGVQKNEYFYTLQSADGFLLNKAYSCHLVLKNVQNVRKDTNMT